MTSQIILFSHPRSGCHFLEKMLFSKQPNLEKCWHPLTSVNLSAQATFDMLQGDLQDVSEEKRANLVHHLGNGCKDWKAALKKAQEDGLPMYMHEHPCFVYTPERVIQVAGLTDSTALEKFQEKHLAVPTELLLHPNTVPLFTIRHPAMTMPSMLRSHKIIFKDSSKANYLAAMYMGWTQDLYDWYQSHGVTPIVADADDYMSNGEYVRHLASAVGLDPEAVHVSWPKISEQEKNEMHPILVQMQSTLVDSKGQNRDRAGTNRDLDAEMAKWPEEFGEKESRMLHEFVELTLPHYEYLRERRLRVQSPDERKGGA